MGCESTQIGRVALRSELQHDGIRQWFVSGEVQASGQMLRRLILLPKNGERTHDPIPTSNHEAVTVSQSQPLPYPAVALRFLSPHSGQGRLGRSPAPK